MGDEDWTTKEVDDWVARGMLTREHVLSRLDHGIKTSHAIHPDEEPFLEAAFASASTSAPSGDNQVLTEPAFISLLKTGAALPQGPEGIEAGRIIYESISYLSTVPFPPNAPQPFSQTGALSLAQLTRGLVWTLPDRSKYIVEESNLSRMRTRFDRQRLLFQSLATSTVPAAAQGGVRDRARLLAGRHAFDVSWEGWLDICAVNHDDDGDEIYHDLLDVLYSTQEARPRWSTRVRRDAFRAVAKQIKAEERLPELHTLAIPTRRFKALVKVLLVRQMELTYDDIGRNVDVSQYDDAADSICAAFAQGQDMGTAELITWPSFSHALETAAPHILEPIYRLLSETFLNQATPTGVPEAPDAPRSLPEDAILTLPRISQLVSFLAESAYVGYLRRMARYISPVFPTPVALVQAMVSAPEYAIVLFSGRIIAASAEQGKPCVFGLFSPAPKKDGGCIQAPSEIDPDNAGQRPCELFQLTPVQDVFRGVVGEAGWSVVADAEGGESIVFGGAGAIDSDEDRKGGVALVLRDGLRRGQIQHWGGAMDVDSGGGEDGGKKKGVVYEANRSRGDWTLEFVVEEIEIWSEVPEC